MKMKKKMEMRMRMNMMKIMNERYPYPYPCDIEGKYESRPASSTLAVNMSNVKLKASVTDATIISGLSFNGFSLSVEEPSIFIIDYNVPKKINPFPLISLASTASSSSYSCYFDS
ncbi:Outer envelope pore protein 24A [Nymphaea thermarum]|nr:Outer envelope pore protein 24A [Nymphaea thermarum]